METASLTPTEFPVVTRSLLADHEKLAASHTPDQINQGVFALIRARKALGDARLACLAAKRLFAENVAVAHRLESLAADLAIAHERFPLTVLQNAPRERPSIMPER